MFGRVTLAGLLLAAGAAAAIAAPFAAKDAVVAHIQEHRFDFAEVALADDQVAADVKHDAIETAFQATPAQPVAVDFAVSVDRGD